MILRVLRADKECPRGHFDIHWWNLIVLNKEENTSSHYWMVLRIIYNSLKLIFWKAEIREVSFAELKTTYVFDRTVHKCLQKYTSHLKILTAAVKHFVAIVTWCPGFVPLCVRSVACSVPWKSEVWSCSWHSVTRWAVTKLCKATGSSDTLLVYQSIGLHRVITQNAAVKGILYSCVRY